ncbi:hypothetical protein [Vibrio gigantis]|uniref:Uncharacterized protein n=1 Tax=Vibrio gigantis TaxID=296199 RepID=A0A5M9NU09_9VIBR|nr:hypothetical protein [Vibrio gigantis]KAA8674235.1 hypothetical protein F4W18_14650 [Vibrio gigantis]
MNDTNINSQEALSMAKESLALAEKLNEETKERMAQTRQMHDAMLVSQRRVCLAFSTLLPKPHQGDFLKAISPEALEDEAQSIVEQVSKRKEADVMNTIINLAIANGDVLEFSVDYDSHNQHFSVLVRKIGDLKKYNFKNVPYLLHEYVSLGKRYELDHEDRPLNELLILEDKLIDLIAEAREASETVAEVEA